MKNLPFLILFCFILSSCTKKDLNPNIPGTVSGQAYDVTNQEPYAGLTITVTELQVTNDFFSSRITSEQVIGSGVTDEAGNYSFKYATTGHGNTYYIGFGKLPANVISITAKDSTRLFNLYNPSRIRQITNVRSDMKFDVNPFKKYIMQSRVVLSNNPYSLLFYNFQSSSFSFVAGTGINAKNADTIINFQVIKNTGGFNISFYVNNAANDSSRASPSFPLNPAIINDTTQGPVFTLDGATFKKN